MSSFQQSGFWLHFTASDGFVVLQFMVALEREEAVGTLDEF
jgi:hypothetical protein